jgi:hypothetical protein
MAQLVNQLAAIERTEFRHRQEAYSDGRRHLGSRRDDGSARCLTPVLRWKLFASTKCCWISPCWSTSNDVKPLKPSGKIYGEFQHSKLCIVPKQLIYLFSMILPLNHRSLPTQYLPFCVTNRRTLFTVRYEVILYTQGILSRKIKPPVLQC